MATFTIKLDDDTLRKLTEAAERAGMTPERWAEMLVESSLSDGDDVQGLDRNSTGVREPARAWKETGEGTAAHDPRTTAEVYEGPFVDLDEALDELSAASIAVRAKALGISPGELAALVLDARSFDYDEFEWPEGGDPRTAAAEPIVEEELRDWEDVRPELEAYLEEKLKARESLRRRLVIPDAAQAVIRDASAH